MICLEKSDTSIILVLRREIKKKRLIFASYMYIFILLDKSEIYLRSKLARYMGYREVTLPNVA